MIPTMNEYHFVTGLEEEKVVSPNKTLEKRAFKKVVKETEGD